MPPARAAKIKFIYDIASPYSYLCFITLLRYREAWNLDIELMPTFLGGIMVATGNSAPSTLPIKGSYLDRDVARLAERWGIDVRSPPGHPLNVSTLNVIRFLRALKDMEPHEVLIQCTRLLFEEFYSVHTPVSSPEFLNCLLSTSSTKGPLTPARLREVVAASQTPENKARIKTDVQYVVDTFGTYGAPWIVAYRVPPEDDPEKEEFNCFFGLDRFEAMGWWLGPEYVWRGPYPDGRPSGDRPIASKSKL